MRQERTVQASLFDLFAEHEIGRELKAMSQWLDEHRERPKAAQGRFDPFTAPPGNYRSLRKANG